MILQSLAEHYQALCEQEDSGICPLGWSNAKVTTALCLDEQGVLIGVLPQRQTVVRGKKEVEIALVKAVPKQETRSSGVKANFLCDTSSYFLGVDAKGKPARAKECFAASYAVHATLLGAVEDVCAVAILRFFEQWNPDEAQNNPILEPYWKELMAGGNLVFRVNGEDVISCDAVRAAWQARLQAQAGDEAQAVCLVSGQRGTTARLHTSVKGVAGAQSMGASIVSFNAPAFESYGKSQSYNAPVSETSMFAYTTALNYLLADRAHTFSVGDTTVVFWAKSAEESYQDAFAAFSMGEQQTDNEELLAQMMENLSKGICCENAQGVLDPDMPFYILGLSPNAARLSVRFFYQNSFGHFVKNLAAHQARLQIVRPSYAKQGMLSIWQMLYQTVSPKAKDKSAAPQLTGEVMHAILNDTNYPATLQLSIMLRIRAEQRINWERVAILKACLTKKAQQSNAIDAKLKEVLQMNQGRVLNEESTYLPYVLGRAFAVLEVTQKAASPGITSTIKDRYFNAACATPAIAFPTLMKLYNSHLKKLMREKKGYAIALDNRMIALLGKVKEAYPKHLNLDEQGAFILGYYHQTQKLFEKTEEK